MIRQRKLSLFVCFFIFSALVVGSIKVNEFQNNRAYTIKDERAAPMSKNVIISYEKVTADIFSHDDIAITETFVFQNIGNKTINTINFWENQTASSIVVSDPEGVINFNWDPITNSSHLITANLRYPLSPNEIATITCSYNLLNDLPYQTNDGKIIYYSFEYHPSISYFTDRVELRVKLPQKTFLYEEDDASTPLYPTNATQTVYQNRIIVLWDFDNVSAFSSPIVLLKFDANPLISPDKAIFTFSFNVFIFGFGIGLFIGISGTFWLIRYREKKAKSEIGKSLLNKNQIKLIQLIYEHEGKLSQRDLCDLTGFSKSKVSRNLVPLEERGLISREKWGRTYVVYLTENGRAVIEQ